MEIHFGVIARICQTFMLVTPDHEVQELGEKVLW